VCVCVCVCHDHDMNWYPGTGVTRLWVGGWHRENALAAVMTLAAHG
jgi:hypothetical protein